MLLIFAMNQLTLISLYGSKNSILKNLLYSIFDKINLTIIGKSFNPYQLIQIHSTIVGLEKAVNDTYYNLNLLQDKNIKSNMDFECLFSKLNSHFPMKIRFGGFNRDFKDFLSFRKKPFSRSFQIDLAKKKIVLIGWPHKNGDFHSKLLWNLRNEIEKQCNIRHKYADEEDNDFYLVLGEIVQPAFNSTNKFKEDILNLENSIRQFLADNSFEIEINFTDLKIAQYTNGTLPVEKTKIYEIENLTSSLIKTLY
jgi:hypothetical protein